MASTLVYESIVRLKDDYSAQAAKVQRASKAAADQMDKTRAAAARPLGQALTGRHGRRGLLDVNRPAVQAPPVQKPPIQAMMPDVMGSTAPFTGLAGALPLIGSALQAVATAATAATAALAGFGFLASRAAAEYESLVMALTAVAGSSEEAERQLARLKEVARLPGLGLEEAIQGSIRLQSVGFDARMAERALLAFGNALALSGGGKAELDGVMLALQQIASRGKLMGEELNQLSERAPQVRRALIAAFGSADTEVLQKEGLSAKAILSGLIDELEKLPRVAGSTKNAFENFGDSIRAALVSIGTVINTTIGPAISQFGDFITNLTESGALADLTKQFMDAGTSAMRAMASIGKFSLTGLKGYADVAGMLPSHSMTAGVAGDAANFGIRTIDFLSESKTAGDFLMRAGSVLMGIFSQLPRIAQGVFDLAATFFDRARMMVEGIIARVLDFMDQIKASPLGGMLIGDTPEDTLTRTDAADARTKAAERRANEARTALGEILNSAADSAEKAYSSALDFQRPDTISGDTSKGHIDVADATERTAKATEELLRLEKRNQSLSDQMLGGGAITSHQVNKVNLDRMMGGSASGGRAGRLLQELLLEFSRMMVASQVATARLNRP